MAKKSKEWERFRVIKPLGAGGFGRTLLVVDTAKGDREVVIKVPHDKDTEKALINELINATALTTSLVGLAHPNIVRCLGFDVFEGYYVMIMEYVKGKDLRDMIGPYDVDRRPMEALTALHYFKNACSGLVEAHRINLLHRDIKPDNIIVREQDDIAKLLDFGISTLIQSASLNAGGSVAGTFVYMAPEALDGRVSRLSDIWSLSVTVYELLTGKLPFWDENLFELKRKIDADDPVEPRRLNPNLNARLSDLVMKGLQKDPAARFQSAHEMQSAFFPIDAEIESLRQMFNGGKEAEAEAKARELLRTSPLEVALYMLIGEFRNRQQQYSQAEEILREGVAVYPNHAGLHFYLAPALFSQGASKKREAVREMEQALRLGLGGSQKVQAERLLNSWSRT